MKAVDVVQAYKLVKKVVSTLKSMRRDSISEFKTQFEEASKIGKQFLSHVLAELEERFVNNPSLSVALGLLYLVPSECVLLGNVGGIPEDLAKAVDLFESDLPHAVMLTTEYSSWVREWKVQQQFLTH